MRKREAHSKSRNGCQNCKRRHVKCDEQGPPCANCVARKTASTCPGPLSQPPASGAAASSNDQGRDVALPSKDPSLAADSSLETCRLLELELFHRWTTSTYISLCSDGVEERHFGQIIVPKAALKTDYLLHGILSVTALEVAVTEKGIDKGKYSCAGMEYYDKASESFHVALTDVNKDNQYCLVFFSVLAACANLVIPHFVRDKEGNSPLSSAVDRMVTFFGLLFASASIAELDYVAFIESPFGPTILKSLSSLKMTPVECLEESAESAFRCLNSIIDSIPPSGSSQPDPQDTALADHYRTIVRKLYQCYIQEAVGAIMGYATCFPYLGGEGYSASLKNREPLALYVLMYWGVLLDRHYRCQWWAMSEGKNVVEEVSKTLFLRTTSRFSGMKEWKEGIAWSRKEVGLEELKEA